MPVVEGYSLPHLTRRLGVGGRHISAYLADLLSRRGYALGRGGTDAEAVRAAKERLCYVAYDFASEVKLARETTCTTETYALPDGRVIRLGAERFTAPEALFDPGLVGLEAPGIAAMVHGCVQVRGARLRRAAWGNGQRLSHQSPLKAPPSPCRPCCCATNHAYRRPTSTCVRRSTPTSCFPEGRPCFPALPAAWTASSGRSTCPGCSRATEQG